MPIPNRNGYYTGQQFTNELGERYTWVGNEWRPAGNDNYTPVSAAREVNLTFNTFLEESGTPVQVRVLVNDLDWEDSVSTNGKVTVKFFDYQIINPTKISFIGNNVRTKKNYVIQCRVNQENDVIIKELGEFESVITPSISSVQPPSVQTPTIEPPTFIGGGGAGSLREVNVNDFRGPGYGIDQEGDMIQRQNIQ
jgi:hypothetical protein